ncbi:uncharacterized protein NECHADRAFT_83497 [Fusarium vanettenii 77-13-4]|uniref:Uncharacterized protein n=1 Tax=Fusarium vanettenii (strain ATCC MYA-4622 / CBS 123669 / FGSC 9596 / NRRL 45880 / 77-13-4) TaxID=660122 RepID=C7Z466_FUSV7|nr:uncharacterized protein NECHADRAFT_83497 [Fusarium vanettenii 77-13-4]EEU41427.1 predicted protein [Fusarium vanettenii 77-13-4]
MAFAHQLDLVDRQCNLCFNPLPLTEEPTPEIEILFPVDMQGALLTMSENISYMDVCLDAQEQICGIWRSAEAIDCFLRPLQGTARTMLVDRLIMHQQALNAAAARLHQDLTNFMQSLGFMGQPDGLEDRAWKMRATD